MSFIWPLWGSRGFQAALSTVPDPEQGLVLSNMQTAHKKHISKILSTSVNEQAKEHIVHLMQSACVYHVLKYWPLLFL